MTMLVLVAAMSITGFSGFLLRSRLDKTENNNRAFSLLLLWGVFGQAMQSVGVLALTRAWSGSSFTLTEVVTIAVMGPAGFAVVSAALLGLTFDRFVGCG